MKSFVMSSTRASDHDPKPLSATAKGRSAMERLRASAAVVLAAFVVAGCAGTPSAAYYSLRNPTATSSGSVSSGPVSTGGLPVVAANTPRGSSSYAISLQNVAIPAQVDRLQIVVTDPGTAQVHLLDAYLWAAPLADEIRAALSADLQRRLGVFDMTLSQLPAGLPAWKISVTVQRFDSVYDSHVALEADWVITPVNQAGKTTRVCGAKANITVGKGVGALVQGHRMALAGVSQLMAAQLAGAAQNTLPSGIQSKGCTKA